MNFIHGRREIKTKLNPLRIGNAITLFGRLYFQSYPSMSRWVNFIKMFKDKSAGQKNQGQVFLRLRARRRRGQLNAEPGSYLQETPSTSPR